MRSIVAGCVNLSLEISEEKEMLKVSLRKCLQVIGVEVLAINAQYVSRVVVELRNRRRVGSLSRSSY